MTTLHAAPRRRAPRFALPLAAVLLAALVCAAASIASPVYPVKKSANGRYLVGQDNAPFLMVGDSPHSLMVNLSEATADSFFADRSAHGFNTVWIELLCQTYTGGRANSSLLDGTLPFTANVGSTGSYDLTKPNEAYFAHVDRVLTLAANHGIMVLLDPIETAGYLTTMLNNGTTRCRTYGQYLGNRYRARDNILWMSGNDFQTWGTASNDAVVTAVALGILDNDTRHLQTVELDYIDSSSLNDPNWSPIIGLNASYTYYPTYARLRADYARATFLPNFMVEANYEFEALQGPMTTAPILRKQEWWTMTSGAAGQLYGNGYTWPFLAGWRDHLDTPAAAQLNILRAFFEPRAWYALVPDVAHTVVTSGYGTYASTGYVASNDFLTAARTADGTLVVAYTPILRTFTVDMSRLSAAATTRWFDPSTGAYTAIAGSPFANSGARSFTPPGANGDGDGGWVLVLESSPAESVPPAVGLTAPAAGATIAGTVTVSANATDNVGVVGLQFQVDAANFGAEQTVAPYTTAWNTLLFTNGSHVVRAVARDLAGNRTIDSLAVTVGNTITGPPTDHLAAAWAFDEASGTTVADASGNGNTGAVHGATFVSGKHGNALNFNGVSNYVEAPNSTSLNIGGTGLTVAFWTKIVDLASATDQVLVGKPWNAGTMATPFYQYGVEYSNSSGKTLNFYFGDLASALHGPYPMTPALGAWTYVVYTYDGATVKGYLDGVLKLSTTTTGSLSPRGVSLRAGADGALKQFFKGALDDVRLYSRALTAAEIMSAMQTPIVAANAGVEGDAAPRSIALLSGAPNPFSGSTRLGFELPAAAAVELGVYDASGRLVRTLARSVYAAGRHDVEWDGADASGRSARPGRYFVRMRVGENVRSVAVVRLR